MFNKESNQWLLICDKLDRNIPLYNLVRRCPLEIMQYWQLRYYNKNTIIFKQNQIYDEFNIVLEGRANVYVQTRDGRKYQQAQYHCGDIIGELEIFERKPYVCTVSADSDLTLLRISRAHFLKWLELDSHFNQQLLLKFSQQYYQLAQKAAENSLYSLHQRLCFYLLSEFECTNNGVISINKKHLSEQFVVTLRSINRILLQLKTLNIIQIEGDQITLLDKAALTAQSTS